MHKVKIYPVKSAIKKVKVTDSKLKLIINKVAAEQKQSKDDAKEQESEKKQLFNATQILEATPVTKSSDITSLIQPNASEETEKEEEKTPAQKSLEPLVQDTAKTDESSASKEMRQYEAPKSNTYSSTTNANYSSAQQNTSQNPHYRSNNDSEKTRSTPIPILQSPWEEKEKSRLDDARSFTPENHERYESRQYQTPDEQTHSSHKKRKRMPWE